MNDRPDVLFVLDTTAKHPYSPRNHTILIDGVEVHYSFAEGKPQEMPYAHAMKFLAIDSFQITDAEKTRFVPPADPKKSETPAGVQLADNEVVARLDELSFDALLLRANMAPGGEKLKKTDGREKVQGFLADHLKRVKDAGRRAAARPERGVGDGDVDDMTDAQLDAMFGGEG